MLIAFDKKKGPKWGRGGDGPLEVIPASEHYTWKVSEECVWL